jgi:tRNA A-37 threonylcarbamoyl transferase component Bud32
VSRDREQTYLSTCPVCREQIDVTSLDPFHKLKCPFCGQMVRVRRNFDHFTIVRQIGEGGMSRVFEAEDETLGRRVALKILNQRYGSDEKRVKQFRQEARITANVNHVNVIKLYTTGYDQGYFYIAMELVNGGSLDQRIKERGKLPEAEVLKIGREVSEGLRAANRLGLVHRDVKPANILFTETGTAKVVDFGLAVFFGSQMDESGEIWATPYYVAPEVVLKHEEDFRSDIYSLGATLYHALTGKPPHKADTNSIDELKAIKSKRVSLQDSGLPFSQRTVLVVNRLLALRPDQRPATYDELVEQLRFAEGLVGRVLRRVGRRKVQWIAAAAGILLAAFLGGWMIRSAGEKKSKSIVATAAADQSLLTGGVTLKAGEKTIAERFVQARRLMLEQLRFAEARHQFGRLVTAGDARQPTLNWARFNLALCGLVMGKTGGATALRRHGGNDFAG